MNIVTATVTSKTKGWYVKDELEKDFSVVKGCTSEVFARTKKLKCCQDLNDTCCISITLPSTTTRDTIDLQFASEDMATKISEGKVICIK